MAKILYENADKVLKKEQPDVSTSGNFKKSRKGGLSDEQKARLIAKRRANIERSNIRLQQNQII